MSAILNLIIFPNIMHLKLDIKEDKYIAFGQAIWHGFSDITHIKDNNGRNMAILNLIELIFFSISLPEAAHLFYGNGVTIWQGFPDITHIKDNNS